MRRRQKIWTVGPNGERRGPFRSCEDAVAQAAIDWPGVPQDDRNEDPTAWDFDITERKSKTATWLVPRMPQYRCCVP